MILIFSEKFDPSTNDIIDWLVHNKKSYFRINIDSLSKINYRLTLNDDSEEVILLINGNEINLHDVDAFWYRRGGLKKLETSKFERNKFVSEKSANEIRKSLEDEDTAIRRFIYKFLSDIPIRIGNYHTGTMNKLDVLRKARNLGIKIPNTIVTNEKNTMIEFYQKNGKQIISKAIHESVMFYEGSHGYTSYVEEVLPEHIEKSPDHFFESKFQTKLEKEIELRIVYLNGKFYSMAIFSQLDDQTSTDFRIYNNEKPNRNVPFQLPLIVENKLNNLMRLLELETASIDMVKTTAGDFVFLEANPVGQFGMTSFPCNYYLEKKIANYLSNGK